MAKNILPEFETEEQKEKRLAMLEKRKANLKPFRKGEARASECGKKGNKRRAESIERKKNISELVVEFMNAELPDASKKTLASQFKDVNPSDLTAQSAMIAGQIQSAIRGNTVAFQSLMSIKEREEKKKELEDAQKRAKYHFDLDIVSDTFHSIMRKIRNKQVREIICEGGRGSTKSSFISNAIVEIMRNNAMIHCLVLRKVGNTLKDSVYSQLQWAIGAQDSEDYFEDKKSPLEIKMKTTGQTIYFRGLDKPEKVKSIKTPFGYIGIIWFEELDQFTEEEVRNVIESAMRGGDDIVVFKSFNPPKSAQNWANQYIKIPKENMLVHHSTYLDVPPEWLGKPFLEEAEHLKNVKPEAYEHEYLGVPNGNGGMVFDDVELREITDEEINSFDRVFQGVDWGYFPDPFVFVRLHYDADSETIYFIDEYVVHKAKNTETAQEIIDRGYDDLPITCDSSEKKSVADYRDLGLNAKPAIKGAGSVEYGMKWLCGRKIVIDPKRTPFVMDEFTKYEYERDKEGNIISGYPDANNHSIDATRYALEKYYNKRENNA